MSAREKKNVTTRCRLCRRVIATEMCRFVTFPFFHTISFHSESAVKFEAAGVGEEDEDEEWSRKKSILSTLINVSCEISRPSPSQRILFPVLLALCMTQLSDWEPFCAGRPVTVRHTSMRYRHLIWGIVIGLLSAVLLVGDPSFTPFTYIYIR